MRTYRHLGERKGAGNRISVVTTNAGGQSTTTYTANSLNQYT